MQVAGRCGTERDFLQSLVDPSLPHRRVRPEVGVP